MPPYRLSPARLSDSDAESSRKSTGSKTNKQKAHASHNYHDANDKNRKRNNKSNNQKYLSNDKIKSTNSAGSTTKFMHSTIYCPKTNVTYEGHVLIPAAAPPRGKNHGGHKNDNETSDLTVHYKKHGRGTLHDHTNNMSIQGFFQNDLIVGHALQTIHLGNQMSSSSPNNPLTLMAQYEGTFQLRPSSTSEPSSHARQEWQRHGTGKYTFHDTHDTYSGQFQNNVFHGHGTFVWGATGDRYEGPFKKGRMHGQGVKYTLDNLFEGTFKRGKAHGWGKMSFGNGDVFDGMYCRDLRQGFGTYTWSNGDSYVGNWDNGRTSGRGMKSILHSMSRSRSGSFLQHMELEQPHNIVDNNARNIDAVQLCRGDVEQVYQGEWDQDSATAEGSGVMTYACRDQYYGSFSHDFRNGYGVYIWANGDVYEGNFVHGVPSGLGIKRMANGDVYDGEWCEGKVSGYGVKTFSSGGAHIGLYEKDERHGYGIMVWPSGDEYRGYFEDGDISGVGIYYYSSMIDESGNFSIYQGHWYKRRKHGPGYFKVHIGGRCRIYFELWCRGKCFYRQKVSMSWRHVPSILQLQRKQDYLEQLKK